MRRKLSAILVIGILLGLLLPLAVPQIVLADTATIYAYKDTHIRRAAADTNYYTSEYLLACGSFVYETVTLEEKPILEFEVNWGSTIPVGATISTATLRLYMYQYSLNPSGSTLWAYRMLRTGWYQTSSTWNDYKFGSTWTTAGGWGSGTDYTTSDSAWRPVPVSAGWVEWTITGQVQWAQSNGQNVYVIIGCPGGWTNGGQVYFRSTEYSGTTLDPQLVITYTVPPPPAQIPIVSTQAASGMAATAAIIAGYLSNDGGESCSVRFQYGTSIAYGVTTSWVSGKTTGSSFTLPISGLLPGTVYHFRAQAQNSAGTGSGDDRTFATLPQAPYNFVATAGNGKVDLTWAKGTGANKIMIRRSTTSYPTTPTSGMQVYFDTGVSYSDTPLTNGVTYYYSAWSWANDVYSSSKVSDSATPTAPAAPTCTTNDATDVTTTSATLNMRLDNLNGAASADVSLQWYKTGEGAWSHETTPTTYTAVGLHYANIAGLDDSSVYYFRAKAVSTQGTGYGSSKSFTTGGYSAPTITTQAATGIMRTMATMNMEVANDGGVSCTVWFQWGELSSSLDYETESMSGMVTDDPYYYGLVGLEAGTTYYFRGVGENTEGLSYGTTLNFTTSTAPTPTVRTDSVSGGANQALLYGTLLTDGDAVCEVRFQWGTNTSYGYNTSWQSGYQSGQAFQQLITGLGLDTEYHYRAQAQNEGGVASGSDRTFNTTFTAPTAFRAKALSDTTIKLEWAKMGDMTLVRFATGSYPLGTGSGTQAYFGTGGTVSISGLTAGTTYYFRAWAWREGNVYSDGYTDDVATTLSAVLPSEEGRPDVVNPPTTPSRWFAVPTGSALVNMPLYNEIMNLADSLDIPEGTWWMGIAILIMILAGGLIFWVTKKSSVALIVAGFACLVCSALTMIPLWTLLVYACFAGGITFVSQRM
jgi:hypothetical protein